MLELIPFEQRMGRNFIPYEVIEAALEAARQKAAFTHPPQQQSEDSSVQEKQE